MEVILKPRQKLWFYDHDRKQVVPIVVDEVYPEDDRIYGTIMYKHCTVSRVRIRQTDIGKLLFYTKKEALQSAGR